MYLCINCLYRLVSRLVNCRLDRLVADGLLKREDEVVNDLKCVHGRLINELNKILTVNIVIQVLT